MIATRRVALIALAACLIATAFLIGAHWVDVGDSTCGGVYRPDLWFDERRCRGRMLLRAAGVLVLVFLGGALLAIAIRGPSRRR